MVENRFVGLRSRGVYETPGGTVLHAARRAVESITMDRDVMHERDRLAPRFAELIYNGFWFAPEMEFLRAAIDASQRGVTGEARVRLFKGVAPDHRPPVAGLALFDAASRRSTRRAATTSATRAASSGSRACASSRPEETARPRHSRPLLRLAATHSGPLAHALEAAHAVGDRDPLRLRVGPVACSATADRHAVSSSSGAWISRRKLCRRASPALSRTSNRITPTRPPSASTADAIAL